MERKLKVELVTYTPNPVKVIGKAGGICWDKEEKENYEEFVKRLIRIGHESVIEHASFTFRIEGVSRSLTHQLVRHRLFSFSQRSQRYVKEREPEYVMPPLEYLDPDKQEQAKSLVRDSMKNSWSDYNALLKIGVKGEDARFVLPNACETKIVVTVNARELRHFFRLRMERHAQWEIRKLACKMYDLVMDIAPALFDDLKPLRLEAGKAVIDNNETED